MNDEPHDLSGELVTYYQGVLRTHGSIYGAGNCSICGVSRCPDWVDASDKLAAAHLLVSEAPTWESYLGRGPR